jgi:long-chain acyl-CoA synthetase
MPTHTQIASISEFLKQQYNNKSIFCIYGEQQITYKEINHVIENLYKSLLKAEVTDQNVAIFSENSPEYICSYLANHFTDNTNIPINCSLTDAEIISELTYCDCNWVLCSERFSERLEKIASDIDVGIISILPDWSGRVILRSQTTRKRCNDSTVAVMLHTSGTTGNPKKVMLTHKNIIANTLSNIESLHLTDKDVVLITLPMFFGYCHTAQFLTHTRLGGTIVIYDQPIFNPKHFCELVQQHKITCWTAVPTTLMLLDKYPYISNYDLSSLRYICFGGGVVSVEMLKSLMSKLPHIGIVQTYGQTECSPRVTALLPEDSIRKLGSVDKPISGVKVEIVDTNDSILNNGKIGESRVQGENTTEGYYKNPVETAKILKNGWLYTGDLGYWDGEGYLYLTGRKKNIIICDGINIYPEEIEKVLLTHPAIIEAIVRSEPNEIHGEIPVADYVSNNDVELTISGLHIFFKDKLAQYKWPKKIYKTEKIEKTATGKPKRIF